MAGKLDKLLVVDVEATCWEDDTPPAGQEAEIIEIGVCLLDIASGARTGKQSIIVRPECSTVTPFCTALTSLTPEQVRGGVAFEHACQILRRKYRSRARVWASYGEFDLRQFQTQCAARGIAYPFSATHINVKSLLAVMHGLPREVGLLRAMELLGLPPEGRHHRGVDDAWNTALLLSRLLLARRGVLT